MGYWLGSWLGWVRVVEGFQSFITNSIVDRTLLLYYHSPTWLDWWLNTCHPHPKCLCLQAKRIVKSYPKRFHFHHTSWGKFLDGTDKIEIGGFTPRNLISGSHVLFLASFHNNDVSLSQMSVMISLLQVEVYTSVPLLFYSSVFVLEHCSSTNKCSLLTYWPYPSICLPVINNVKSFVESLTVVLPYYPTGTMERVVREGQVRYCFTLFQSHPYATLRTFFLNTCN